MNRAQLAQICQAVVAWLNQQHNNDEYLSWSPQDWAAFRFVCRVHGVAPLLAAHAPADFPAAAWLQQQAEFNRQRIARLQTELAEILRLFADHGVPLMPLKGAVLTAQYYAEPGLRPMADLDLLVHAADFARAGALLKQLGYQPRVAHWKHTEFLKPDNRHVVNPDCEHPDNPRRVELHAHCRESFGGPTLDLTALMWEEATVGRLLGEPAYLPRPAALGLHLLAHGSYHFWQGRGRLLQLVDLSLLSQQRATFWAELAPLLAPVEARYSYPAMALLARYFPASMGTGTAVLQQQEAQVSRRFRRWVATLNLVDSSYLRQESAGLYIIKALRFSEGRPMEVLQALRFALLPRMAELALDHPRLARSSVPWLAYFLLPLDWFKRWRGLKNKVK